MRNTWTVLVIALLLGILFYLVWRPDHTGKLGKVSSALQASSTPSESLPPTEISARREVAPNLRFMLQDHAGADHVPLVSGSARFRGSESECQIAIDAGVAQIPPSCGAGNGELLDVIAGDGTSLNFTPQRVSEGGAVRCYAYPGFFTNCEAESTRTVSVLAFSGVANLPTTFRVPPSARYVTPLATDGVGPTYVSLDNGVSPFYLVRVEGYAWQRFDADKVKSAEKIEVSAIPCGAVVFEAVSRTYTQTPRLIVLDAIGETVMTPFFTEDVLAPIDGWPVGEYTAVLDPEESGLPKQAVMEVAKFAVLAGQTTKVQLLPLNEVEQRAGTGYLQGVLQFEAWEQVAPWHENFGLRLSIESLVDTNPVAENNKKPRNRRIPTRNMTVLSGVASGNPAWAWDAGEYLAGQYRLHVEPIRAWVDFEIRAGQKTVLDVPIPTMSVLLLSFGTEIENLKVLSPILSFPTEWKHRPDLNESPPLIPSGRDSAMMIAPPGKYSLGLMWGADIVNFEIELVPGWNTLDCKLAKVATAIIAFIDEEGKPVPWTWDHWQALSFQSFTGEPLQTVPRHVRKGGMGGWSEGTVVLPEGGQVRLVPLKDQGNWFSRTELVLEDGERAEIVVR